MLNKMLRCTGMVVIVIYLFSFILHSSGHGTPHLVPKLSHETSAAEVQEWAWGTMLMLYNLSFPGKPPSGRLLLLKIFTSNAHCIIYITFEASFQQPSPY